MGGFQIDVLKWQFRLHSVAHSRQWQWLMMACVAGSVGMLASEYSGMDPAILWQMVQV